MADGQDNDYLVRAVERVCAILSLLQESVDGVSLAEIAAATELPKSSAFRYLYTLEVHRYVEHDQKLALYRLGLGFVTMQSRQVEVLRQHIRPWLESLRDQLGETLNLGILDGDSVIYLDIVESRRSVRQAASTRDRDPIYSTALGKAIAAHLPEDRVRDILSRSGMPTLTANTITNIDDYLRDLAKVRRIGYAMDDGENEVDGRCVAVPILPSRLPAALSLSAPASRLPLQRVDEVATCLKEAADSVGAMSPTYAPPTS